MAAQWTGFQIEIVRGDTTFLDLTVTLAGVAQNITGWDLWFTAKHRVGDPDNQAVIQKRLSTGGISVVSAAAGTAFVALLPGDTSSLPATTVKLFADVQGKDGAGNIYTLQRGTLTVLADVTDAIS